MLRYVCGDLLDAKETYICHQCNCVSYRAKHLAYSVFKRFPYANVYRCRHDGEESEPGTIEIRGNGKDKRFVIALFAQVFPGKSLYPHDKDDQDSYLWRSIYFKECLEALKELDGTFAMPYGIGCGAAGADWKEYIRYIEEFAQHKDVTLYELNEP